MRVPDIVGAARVTRQMQIMPLTRILVGIECFVAGYPVGTHLPVRARAWKLFRRVPALVMSHSYELRADFHDGSAYNS